MRNVKKKNIEAPSYWIHGRTSYLALFLLQSSMEEEVINKAQAISIQSDSKEITIPFETQKTNYYCGPAAAKMVLEGIGYSVTQEYMAGLLGTTTNGTNAGNNVDNALNQVVSGSKFQFL